MFPKIFVLLRLLMCFVQLEEDEKLKKRKERFGALTSGGTIGSGDVEVTFYFFVCWCIMCSHIHIYSWFLFALLQAKKMKRAERFGKV